MKQSPDSSPAWYALRRTLPPFRFEELLAELVEHLPRYGVDEVMILEDTEELFHGHPTPATAAASVRNLHRVREALAEVGIAYSLNPWITRGHADRGRGALPGMQTVVRADGSQETCIACPLCPVWRDNLRQVWAMYAATRPRALWIDDDIRDVGDDHECYCPLHLERFAKKVGHPVTRQQVVAAVFQPGAPHPWRGWWLDMRQDGTLEVMRLLAQASAGTPLGLMSSGARHHCREGRDWAEVAAALGDNLHSRPTMGNYWEWGPPRGLYFSQDSVKLTRHCLPPGTVDLTELESVPFSRYSKSVAFTFAQLALSFAYGARGAAINIFDHLGSPMQAEAHYGKMLGARKAFLNALAQRAQLPGSFRGVQLLYRKDAGRLMHLTPGAGSAALAGEGYPALEAFEAAGIPTTYDESAVMFLCGQQPRTLSDEEIGVLLGKGLFVDGAAAAILCERGFAAELGLVAAAPPTTLEQNGIISGETFSHPQFGGGPDLHMSAYLPMADYGAKLSQLQPLAHTEVVSHFFDPDMRPLLPAMTACVNARGGRVVVHAWDYASAIGPVGISFHSPTRQRQLHGVVRWLFHNQPPLLVSGDGVWPLVLRKDCQDGSLLACFNLSLDPWPGAQFELHLPRPPADIWILDPSGSWQPAAADAWQAGKFTAHCPITLEQPLVIWFNQQHRA